MDISTEEQKACEGMLAALGKLPVEAENRSRVYDSHEPVPPEERLAALLLTEARQDVLCQGWHFNTARITCCLKEDDEGGKSDLCTHNILKLLENPPSVVLRGDVLHYHGKPFPQELVVRAAIDLEFKDLPLLCNRLVVVRATRNLQDRLRVSPTLHAFTERQEAEAYGLLKQWEAEQTCANMLRPLMRR